jgi:alkylation response protein AidB-like acyl-CoA dehydrogenase
VDFRFSDEEEAYRREVRAWLQANVPDATAVPADAEESEGDAAFERQRTWHRTLYEAGYVGATWPVEYGGRGISAVQNAILQEELILARSPQGVNGLGIGLCGPALLHHGSDEQKARYLAPMLRGDEIWCQGYSEPGAGSDLASLATRADRDGDHWVVNGQKTWTSLAHRADWCFALVRSDPDAPRKHDGIGFLLIDMRTPGIEVRPITMITGRHEFNETFFQDVRVPVENMVGEPTQGWRIANTVLSYERGANTLSQYAGYRREFERLAELARAQGGARAAVFRDRLAQLAIDVEALRLNSLRQLTALSRGEAPGSEASIQKLFWSELDQRFYRLGVDLQGAFGQLVRGDERVPYEGDFQHGEVNSRRFTIARGTSEIQRNIISERVLGLPRA